MAVAPLVCTTPPAVTPTPVLRKVATSAVTLVPNGTVAVIASPVISAATSSCNVGLLAAVKLKLVISFAEEGALSPQPTEAVIAPNAAMHPRTKLNTRAELFAIITTPFPVRQSAKHRFDEPRGAARARYRGPRSRTRHPGARRLRVSASSGGGGGARAGGPTAGCPRIRRLPSNDARGSAGPRRVSRPATGNVWGRDGIACPQQLRPGDRRSRLTQPRRNYADPEHMPPRA